VALIGKNHADLAVMTDALDDNPAVIDPDHVRPADAHVAGLLNRAVRTADIAVATMAFKPVPSAAAIAIADNDAAAGTSNRKLEAYAPGIGGRGGCGDAGSGDNEGGECIANEGVHGCSPDLAAFHALNVCP